MHRLLYLLIFALIFGCSEDSVKLDHPFTATEKNLKSFYWYDLEGMNCRDGSPTGIGHRVGNPKKLAVYINGGGACFNAETCAGNPKSFNVNDWDNLTNEYGNRGIFDVDNPKNPLKDYSYVFLPYCTGDVHSGTRHSGVALGVEERQKYVGAINFRKAMDFITPYYEYQDVEEIVLFGLSAGGYGVYINFVEITKRFPKAKITVINDSGPLFSDEQAFPQCLQAAFTLVYGIPLPNDLLDCCNQPALGLANVYQYSSKKYPKANFGFITSYEDATSRFFLSFGFDDCTGAPNNQLPADVFREGIINLREDVLKPKSDWSTYYINGDSHTLLADNDIFYNRNAAGMYLYEWVDRLLKGENMHVTE
jgi:hypothetical protein